MPRRSHRCLSFPRSLDWPSCRAVLETSRGGEHGFQMRTVLWTLARCSTSEGLLTHLRIRASGTSGRGSRESAGGRPSPERRPASASRWRAEQRRRIGEHDDADLAVGGEKQGEGERGQVPVMADDSAAVEVCRKNVSPTPDPGIRAELGRPHLRERSAAAGSVLCAQPARKERLGIGRHVGHRGTDRPGPSRLRS